LKVKDQEEDEKVIPVVKKVPAVKIINGYDEKEEVVPTVIVRDDDSDKKEIKIIKKVVDEDNVESKLEKVIEHHDEIGKVLEGIKE